MSDVMLQIQVMRDGSIQVVDGGGKLLPSLTPEEFSAKLPGKEVKRSELCTILYTNPCVWVYVNGKWQCICW